MNSQEPDETDELGELKETIVGLREKLKHIGTGLARVLATIEQIDPEKDGYIYEIGHCKAELVEAVSPVVQFCDTLFQIAQLCGETVGNLSLAAKEMKEYRAARDAVDRELEALRKAIRGEQ